MAANKTGGTRYTSESQRHWWNGAAKLFAAGASEMRGMHGFSGGWQQ